MLKTIARTLLAPALLLALAAPAASNPLLTGVIEDVDAQTIEMPSLPGGWQRRIEWMAPEGSEVQAGDLIVRLDPGTLISEEEKGRTDLEKQRFTAARSIDELKLLVLDAEQALARAESDLRIAELDAVIPADTIPRLDYERNQLTLATAQQTLARAGKELANQRAALKDREAQSRLEVEQAELKYQRIRDGLKATEIRAEKAGFMIYADNPFTGRKIFPGDTLYAGLEIASIASRKDLQVRMWVHEADFLAIEPGKPLRVATDAQGIAPFDAIVSWRSSQAVAKEDWSDSGYFEALAKPTERLAPAIMPGMSVLAVIAAPQE